MLTWFIAMDPFLPSYNFPLSQLEESQAGDLVPSTVSFLLFAIFSIRGDSLVGFFYSHKLEEYFLLVVDFI